MRNSLTLKINQLLLDATSESIHSTFGPTTSEVYYCINSDAGVNLMEFITNTSISSFATSHGVCKDITYANKFIYMTTSANSNIVLWIYFSVDYSLACNQTFSNPTLATNVNIQATSIFYCISFSASVYIYYSANNTNACNLTSLRQNIYDIKITDHWIYISFTNVVEQYDV